MRRKEDRLPTDRCRAGARDFTAFRWTAWADASTRTSYVPTLKSFSHSAQPSCSSAIDIASV